ncbi:MAG: L,D-transpeptidase [Rhizobiaceae bacterium]|nr:L,D-transpeptidase [Rhizobiaceae bacterium]
MSTTTSRRLFLSGALASGATALAMPAIGQEIREPGDSRRNISAFRLVDWRDHFDSLKGGVIIADTTARALQYWSEDESVYKVYPTSVPLSEDLTRLGYTEVIRKVEGPSWAPTPEMKKRNPEWPDFVGPGPDNPLGTHALYLSWQYYRIHGSNDTRKIGRRSSNGCIGLYNEQIAELFGMAWVGTQVKLI